MSRSATEQYYLRSRGRRVGPISRADLTRRRQRGELGRAHQVSVDGQTWHPAGVVDDLISGRLGSLAALSDTGPSWQSESVAGWYVYRNGEQRGPLPTAAVVDELRSGQLAPTDLVCQEGGTDWTPAGEMAQFGRSTAPSPKSSSGPLIAAGLIAAVLCLGVGWMLLRPGPAPTDATAVAGESTAGENDAQTVAEDATEDATGDATENSTENATESATGDAIEASSNQVPPPTGAGPPDASPLASLDDLPAVEEIDDSGANEPDTDTALTDPAAIDLDEAVGLVIVGLEGTTPAGRTQELAIGSGTAFVVSAAGDLVTNRHVVDINFEAAAAAGGRTDDEDGFFQIVVGFANLCGRSLSPDRRSDRAEVAAALRSHYDDGEFTGASLDDLIAALRRLEVDVSARYWVFLNRRKSVARLDYVSDRHDLAVLNIDRPCRHVFTLAGSPQVGRGDTVRAYGYPGASEIRLSEESEVEALLRHRSATRVESTLRDTDFDFTALGGEVSKPPFRDAGVGWIQSTCAIAPGCSGGPLVNEAGVVVAVNTIIHAEQAGYSFSLAVDGLRSELNREVRGLKWTD